MMIMVPFVAPVVGRGELEGDFAPHPTLRVAIDRALVVAMDGVAIRQRGVVRALDHGCHGSAGNHLRTVTDLLVEERSAARAMHDSIIPPSRGREAVEVAPAHLCATTSVDPLMNNPNNSEQEAARTFISFPRLIAASSFSISLQRFWLRFVVSTLCLIHHADGPNHSVVAHYQIGHLRLRSSVLGSPATPRARPACRRRSSADRRTSRPYIPRRPGSANRRL